MKARLHIEGLGRTQKGVSVRLHTEGHDGCVAHRRARGLCCTQKGMSVRLHIEGHEGYIAHRRV